MEDIVAEEVGGDAVAAGGADDAHPGRRVDGPDLVAVVLIAAAVCSVFWYTHRYAAEMFYFDQFTTLDVLRHAHDGTLSFSVLWAQHNENRVLFPNLLDLLLASTTHFRVVVQDYLNGALTCVAAALVVLTHKRRSPTVPWIVYCPVFLVLCSFACLNNVLFGFNLSWYLVLACLAASMYVLDRPGAGWAALAGAAALAIVGSYSSAQGLLIWPAGLVLLLLRGCPWRRWTVWTAAGVVTTLLYFIGFTSLDASGSPNVIEHHPLAALNFFVEEVGNVFGGGGMLGFSIETVGVLLLLLAAGTVAVGVRRDPSGGGPVGAALMVFGLLFVGTVATGREQLGIPSAVRYLIFTLLLWVGAYLVLVSTVNGGASTGERGWAGLWHWFGFGTPNPDDRHGTRRQMQWRVGRGLFLVFLVLFGIQWQTAMVRGSEDGRSWQIIEGNAANVEVNIGQASDGLVVNVLSPRISAQYVRRAVAFARADRLGIFDTPAGSRSTGLDPALLVQLRNPENNTAVRGHVLFNAVPLLLHPKEVQFVITPSGGRTITVGPAAPTPFGWYIRWNSAGYVGDRLTIRARALSTTGASYWSPSAVVWVRRP